MSHIEQIRQWHDKRCQELEGMKAGKGRNAAVQRAKLLLELQAFINRLEAEACAVKQAAIPVKPTVWTWILKLGKGNK